MGESAEFTRKFLSDNGIVFDPSRGDFLQPFVLAAFEIACISADVRYWGPQRAVDDRRLILRYWRGAESSSNFLFFVP
jgi:hypothetical protein